MNISHRAGCEMAGLTFWEQAGMTCTCSRVPEVFPGNGEQPVPSKLDQLRAAALDTSGLDDIPEPEPLVNGLLYSDTTAWIIGKAGHGKSFVALDMAGCIATGVPWQDHSIIQGHVLYVVAEGAAGIRVRVRAWEKSYGRKMTGITFLPVAVQAAKPGDWQALVAFAQEIGAVLIILDTQSRITVSLEENSARDMGEFIEKLERLRIATRACVLTVHHKGRGTGDHMRGSSAMDGAGDTVIEVSKDGDTITVKNPKQKHIEEHEPIQLRLSPMGDSATLTVTDGRDKGRSAARVTAVRWWELFGADPVSATKAFDAELATKATFYRHVAELQTDGLVVKEGTGNRVYYRLVGNPGGETWE